jgi:DNA/RNA-binding domain of Phe-tRNA-synthetase-like protein
MRKIIIDEKIFETFPNFKRGLIIVEDINNAPENEAIKTILDAEMEKRASTDNLENEFITAWDEAHRKFDSNPNKFPPSIKSLIKRIQKGGGFPFINSVVALFNYISIKYLIPCGGDDINTVKGNLKVAFAEGNENFIGLGSDENESPVPGEVIYFDDEDKNVMCRRWNWRNSSFTKITEDTKKIVINIDGIDPVPRETIEEARDELAELLEKECNAKISTAYIDKETQEVEIYI